MNIDQISRTKTTSVALVAEYKRDSVRYGLCTLAIVVSRLNPLWMVDAVFAGHGVSGKHGTGHRGFKSHTAKRLVSAIHDVTGTQCRYVGKAVTAVCAYHWRQRGNGAQDLADYVA